MTRILIFVSILISSGPMTRVSEAQLFRGNAAPPTVREPARVGLLGGIREAREERFRREEQAAAAAARAAAAQRNAAIAPRSNPNAAQQQAANVASNNAQRPDASANPLTASSTTKADPSGRSANFRGSSGAALNRGQETGLANSKINPNNSLSRPSPATSSAAVTPASATAFVPEPLGYSGQKYDGQEYDGPGVVIRLSKEARSVVNFLVDEINTSAVRPGEQQVLDSKGSYVVRYSRGVTRDGRSFGESRYTITEGRYRFELTATGWELYREADADTNTVPLNPLDLAENPIGDRQPSEQISPQPSLQSELQRPPLSQFAERSEATINKPSVEPVTSKPTTIEPTTSEPVTNQPQAAPAANEEVLPAPKPRSILE